MRIIKQGRRYGRGNTVVASHGATHVIKIGFNKGGADGKTLPGKFNGFCVYEDKLGNDNKPVIAFDAMERLGFKREMIQTAIAKEFNAPPECLPQQLHFVIMADAVATEAGWAYPGTFAESYECYTKAGLFCYGDGCAAMRKQDNGTKAQIECIPYGQEGADPDTFCRFSGPGQPCKTHYRLMFCLLVLNKETNRLEPLLPQLGQQARYRLDSSSEYGSIAILEELDRAANRVQGRINGLVGMITFQKKKRRTGGQGVGASIVGHVLFQINEDSIRAREEEIAAGSDARFNRLLEAKRAGLALDYVPASDMPRMLPAPTSDAEPVGRVADQDRKHTARRPQPQPIDDQPIDWIEEAGAEVAGDAAEPIDVPVDGPTQSETAALCVATATDDQLVKALDLCAAGMAADFRMPYDAALRKLTNCTIDGRQFSIGDIGYFTSGAPGDSDAKRRALLRDICAGLEANGQRGFILTVEEVKA